MTLGLFILLQERTFADALAIRFEREPDVHVVAALDATVLPSRVFVSSQVDVVLLDADLADNAAFYLCQELSQARDAPCVIFLSHSSDPECIVRAIRAGAAGWVRKDESLTRLIYVIRGVARGETWLPPDQTGEVLRLLMRGPDRDEDGGQLLMALTGREREVLLCLANGNRRRDVAERLHMSPNTVRTHLQNLMAKLDVHSALEAVALTRRLLDEDLSLRPYGRPHPGPYGRPRPGTPGHMRLRPRPREDQDPAKAKTPPRPRPRQGQDPAKAKTAPRPRPRQGQAPAKAKTPPRPRPRQGQDPARAKTPRGPRPPAAEQCGGAFPGDQALYVRPAALAEPHPTGLRGQAVVEIPAVPAVPAVPYAGIPAFLPGGGRRGPAGRYRCASPMDGTLGTAALPPRTCRGTAPAGGTGVLPGGDDQAGGDAGQVAGRDPAAAGRVGTE